MLNRNLKLYKDKWNTWYHSKQNKNLETPLFSQFNCSSVSSVLWGKSSNNILDFILYFVHYIQSIIKPYQLHFKDYLKSNHFSPPSKSHSLSFGLLKILWTFPLVTELWFLFTHGLISRQQHNYLKTQFVSCHSSAQNQPKLLYHTQNKIRIPYLDSLPIRPCVLYDPQLPLWYHLLSQTHSLYTAIFSLLFLRCKIIILI